MLLIYLICYHNFQIIMAQMEVFHLKLKQIHKTMQCVISKTWTLQKINQNNKKIRIKHNSCIIIGPHITYKIQQQINLN